MVGAGGLGAAAARVATEREFFQTFIVADADLERARACVAAVAERRPGEFRFFAAQVDVADEYAVAVLAAQYGATHVLNAADPRLVIPIFRGAMSAGADYVDMAMSLSRPHPGEAHGRVSLRLGEAQFALAPDWSLAGRLALVGMGGGPGLSDVFARHAAEQLFSSITELSARSVADLRVHAENGRAAAPGDSMWTRLERCLNPALVWERSRAEAAGGDVDAGLFTVPPFSGAETFDFPEGIGPVECVHVEHEEAVLMPRWVDAERVTVKHGLGEPLITALRAARPDDPDQAEPALPAPLLPGRSCEGLYVSGLGKDGAPRAVFLYHLADDERTLRDYGVPCRAWQTAVNPIAALELLATGVWSGQGVLGPEALTPRPFLDLLKAPRPIGYGVDWKLQERDPATGQPR